jgi:hypothetical protein
MDGHNGGLDVQRLIGAVAERHSILLKPDDAAFALVTMNQLVLEEVVTKMLGKMAEAAAEFEQAAERVQSKAGGLLARQVREAVATIRSQLETDIATAGIQARELILQVGKAHSRPALAKWISLGLVCGLVLFLCGIFVGKMQ